MLRSTVFAAARRGDTEQVKKCIWEDNVEADGGEIRPGCETFVKQKPNDASETLLHISASLGNVELVEYLEKRGAYRA
jgi:ankyrin repeat protein